MGGGEAQGDHAHHGCAMEAASTWSGVLSKNLEMNGDLDPRGGLDETAGETAGTIIRELSDQVQRAVGAVNLDSLFIDEGFATLDPDTLALVSETLQGLWVGGRMVGIITHIPELRDEFAQQV